MTETKILVRTLALTALVALGACAGTGPGTGSGTPVPATPDNLARERSQTPPIFDSNRGAPL